MTRGRSARCTSSPWVLSVAMLAGRRVLVGRVAVRAHADEEIEHLADGPLLADRAPQRQVLLDAVPVAATVLVLDHVAGGHEIGDHAVGGALGEAERGGDVPQPDAR